MCVYVFVCLCICVCVCVRDCTGCLMHNIINNIYLYIRTGWRTLCPLLRINRLLFILKYGRYVKSAEPVAHKFLYSFLFLLLGLEVRCVQIFIFIFILLGLEVYHKNARHSHYSFVGISAEVFIESIFLFTATIFI